MWSCVFAALRASVLGLLLCLLHMKSTSVGKVIDNGTASKELNEEYNTSEPRLTVDPVRYP